MIGQLLDHRYQVIKALGTGGFGQTYLAQDTRRPGNPICVVKHLKPASSDPRVFETAKRLFQSEAETLERLGNHDQIPRLLAYFDENLEFFLVQEFIDGHTLATELVPGQRWSEPQVIQMLQEVLGVLEFVHNQGVIHRDIKPDNIIRRVADQKLVLVDFGAVKQLRTQMVVAEGMASATVAIGTPGYMSTEQGQRKPRPNSDIYALGIIAIQALTGRMPMDLQEDPHTGEILWQHLVPVSPSLAAVLTKMVRYHFKDRYQSATENLQALQQLITGSIPTQPAVSPVGYNPNPVPSNQPNYGEYQNPQSPSGQPNYGGYQNNQPPSGQPNYGGYQSPPPPSTARTVAVSPGNPNPPSAEPVLPPPPNIPTPLPQPVGQPSRRDRPDFTPFIVLAFLAAGTAAAVTVGSRLLPNFSGNRGVAAGDACLAVVKANTNIRSQPNGSVVDKVTSETQLAATGNRRNGWLEVKLENGRSAWVFSNLVSNQSEVNSCLQAKENQGGTETVVTNPDSTDDTAVTSPPVVAKPKPTKPIRPDSGNSAPPKPDQATDKEESNAKTLEEAQKRYDAGDLKGAIALLQKSASDIQQTAKTIQEWKAEWDQAQTTFDKFQKALEAGKWDEVAALKDDPQLARFNKYWQGRLDDLIKQAEKQIKEQQKTGGDGTSQPPKSGDNSTGGDTSTSGDNTTPPTETAPETSQ